MKKIISVTDLIIVFVFMLWAMSACSNTAHTNVDDDNSEITSNENQPINTESTVNIEELIALYGEPMELKSSDVPTTYKADVFSNIRINAEVSFPNDLSFGKLRVNENKLPDNKKIKNLFINDPAKEESYDGDVQFYYGSDGSTLSIVHQEGVPDHISYYSGEDSFVNRGIDNVEVQGNNSYKGFIKGANTLISDKAKVFFDETEIYGLSLEGAVSAVREKINALEIECYDKPQVFVIDSEGVAEYRAYFKENFPTATSDETEFTSEDDAYFILFNIACKGMPVNGEFWHNSKKMTGYDGQYAYGVVNHKGILEFYTNTGYTVAEETEANLKLYNADIVEKVIKKQFDIGIETKKCEFVSLKLEYLCTGFGIADGEELVLEPCWVCQYNMIDTINGREKVNTNLIFIKAATGELVDNGNANADNFVKGEY